MTRFSDVKCIEDLVRTARLGVTVPCKERKVEEWTLVATILAATMKAMKTGMRSALLVAAIGAANFAAHSQPAPANAAGWALIGSPKPLYQANWKKGLGNWKVFQGFAVSHGMLTYDGSGDAGAFAPYHSKSLKNFAVEANIKVGTLPSRNPAWYEIFAKRSSQTNVTGIFGGYAGEAGESTAKNVSSLYWNTGAQHYAPGTSFNPDGGFHTYRLESRGDLYRLLIDGRETVPWTLVKLAASGDMVGLVFTHISAQVKSFRVLALPKAHVTTTFDTGTVLKHALRPTGDVSVPLFSIVYRDNSRYTADNQLDLSTVQGIGRIYGLAELFSSNDGSMVVTESVNVHQSAAGAASAFNFFRSRLQQAASQDARYHQLDTSGIAGGSVQPESFGFTFGEAFASVLFHVGSYYVAVNVSAQNATAGVAGQQAIHIAERAITYAALSECDPASPLPCS